MAGNKADIDDEEWEIREAGAMEKLGELGLKDELVFRETSAKTGMGVRELFADVAERLVQIKQREHESG